MEENEKIGEEPQALETPLESEEEKVGSPNSIEEEMPTGEAERGVPIGKFKSVDDLVKAYDNLQKEFTRKSQRLAEMEKRQAEPQEQKEEDALATFLSKNQEAVVYAEELRSRVQNDESHSEQAYDRAWATLLYEKLTAKDKTTEPIVQNLILKDDEIQNLVIKNYMKQLQKQQIPFVMSSNSGERVTKTVAPKPDSFEEAKRVAIDLLK